jgi:tetratricopeptide (TPR) repeat protein
MDWEQIQRIELLLEQDRVTDAEKILHTLLPDNPDSAYLKYLQSRCREKQGDNQAAMQYIDEAIGLQPDSAWFFFHKSCIYSNMNKPQEAHRFISEAISLDSQEAAFYGLKALLLYNDKQFQKALDEANQGLAMDPENTTCLNVRSLSQSSLHQSDNAEETIKDALRSDPNNAFTHTTQAYLLLRKGESKKALEEFKEALRIDPHSEYAKSGLVEALKSQYLLYKWFYLLFDFIGTKSARFQCVFIFGFIVIRLIADRMASVLPDWALVFNFISYSLLIFVLLTWVIVPLSDLLLRLSPYGRYALSKDEIRCSNWSSLLVGLSLITFVVWIFTQNYDYLFVAITFFFSILPVSVIFRFKSHPDYRQIRLISLLFIAVWYLAAALSFTNLYFLWNIVLVAFLAYQIYINNKAIRRKI